MSDNKMFELLISNEESTWLHDALSNEERIFQKTTAKISALIQFRRKELNLSQKEFAKTLGVTQGMVSRWESGEYNFSFRALAKLSDKLGQDLLEALDVTESFGFSEIIQVVCYAPVSTQTSKPVIGLWNDDFSNGQFVYRKGAVTP